MVNAVCGLAEPPTTNMSGFDRAIPPRPAPFRVLSATIWQLARVRFQISRRVLDTTLACSAP